MCQNPARLPNGVEIACRKCWQCRQNRVNDWVGRCIAETHTARHTRSVTLTYGRDLDGREDHERAAVLTYSDLQKYFKLLRRHGYPLRYFAVGEYGSTKGRAHWHVVMFFSGDMPEHQLAERVNERHWPHGYSFWEEPTPAAIRYVCKYIQKDIGADERQGHLAMSKKPPLGSAYFVELAGRYVSQGLAPQEPYYSFPDVRDDKDRPVRFYMRGTTLDTFCRAFLDQWAKVHGGHPPQSEVIEDYCDRLAKIPTELRLAPFVPRTSRPWLPPPGGAPVQFSEPHNAYFCEVNGERLFWSYDEKGERSWESVIKTEAQAEFARTLHELRAAGRQR